jgi:glycosyltransferase involved in cell wall biosynthesis
MIIGFDAKRAFFNTTGLGNYSRTLIRSLAEKFPDNEYKLFTPGKSNLFSVLPYKNMSIHTPQTFPGNFFKAAWRSAWMVKDLERENVDVYHGLSHEIPRGIQDSSVKSVVTIHDLIHERFPNHYPAIDRKIYSRKFRYACEHSHKIIAISEQTKKDIIEIYGINPLKIEVIYQSADEIFLTRFTEEEKNNFKKKYHLPDRFILSVGSIIERKNLLQTVKAIQQTKDINLVVLGDGKEYKEKVKKYITEKNLSDRIIFLNEKHKIKNEELPLLYQTSKGLIYISSYEGFGLPVLEGILSGIPVIAANTSSLPEAGGNCVVYADPEDISELSNAIEKINGSENIPDSINSEYQRHISVFSKENMASKVMHLYQKL